jgi:hypothetical protein
MPSYNRIIICKAGSTHEKVSQREEDVEDPRLITGSAMQK